ncbi:MAG: hypothetical protein JSV21_06205 [Nitrospirota bacterium]|nr:MAG: hypothetical protein JSV21_06205 [Nitrospirota bacterium]
MARKVRLRSDNPDDFNTEFIVKGINYHVQTEEGSEQYPFITSTAYMGGIIVEKMKTEYPPVRKGVEKDKEELRKIMKRHHELMIDKMKRKHIDSTRDVNEFIRDASKLLKRKKLKEAYDLIEDAIALFPKNPFIMSLHGYLRAAIKKQYREGADECKTALQLYDPSEQVGGDRYLGFFNLNVARAYLLYGSRDVGIRYLRRGLVHDPGNREIINELILLGIRKRPPIPFLDRNNVLNKYMGKFLTRFGIR